MTLVVMLPVGATFLPGAELDAWTCCVPLVNLSLLIRALMTGPVAVPLLFLTLLSSLAYAGLAVALAARVFGREQILLGGPFSWRGLLRGDRQRPAVPTPGLVLAWFPLAAVGLFYASLALAEHGWVDDAAGEPIRGAAAAGAGAGGSTEISAGPNLLPAPAALAQCRGFGSDRAYGINRACRSGAPGGAPPDSVLREMQELLQLG